MKSREWNDIEKDVTELFGSPELAVRWLNKPLAQFEGRTARQVYDCGEGEQVEALILRAKHGFVF